MNPFNSKHAYTDHINWRHERHGVKPRMLTDIWGIFFLCSTEERKLYDFWTAWGWV